MLLSFWCGNLKFKYLGGLVCVLSKGSLTLHVPIDTLECVDPGPRALVLDNSAFCHYFEKCEISFPLLFRVKVHVCVLVQYT